MAVKNSRNGSLNPYAQHRKPLTIQEVLASRMIADPLTLYMCSSIGDGAAAAILCSRDFAERHARQPLIEVAACVLRSGMFRYPQDTTTLDTVTLTAQEAYRQAGMGPQDIHVAEVHDTMAPAELLLYEQLGLCEKGKGPLLIDQERTFLTGDIPVNPSGGLTARGHPVGATGLAQVAELVWQLRGEAGDRQVARATTGLAQNVGGLVDGDNAACSVIILKR